MKKLICLFAMLTFFFAVAPQLGQAHAVAGTISTEYHAGPKPIKKLIKWAKRFYTAYEIYDTVSGMRMSCGTAYNYAVHYYSEYERLYNLACYYWGTDYGYACYNGAIESYNLAVYYNNRLYECR